jgi:hypothetical protein
LDADALARIDAVYDASKDPIANMTDVEAFFDN